jgi:protocatechuate 3,4-dioxygenase alpha subunit
MTDESNSITSGSQTVGPYFHIGLEWLIADASEAEPGARDSMEIRGRVMDRDGVPVPDAMLEFWGADRAGVYAKAEGDEAAYPAGFHRVITDAAGSFRVAANKPGAVMQGDGRKQAPHFLVLVFARGLLRHLITRVYFGGDEANEADPVLLGIAPERRVTLVAQLSAIDASVFEWNVILQGERETVFFAW